MILVAHVAEYVYLKIVKEASLYRSKQYMLWLFGLKVKG